MRSSIIRTLATAAVLASASPIGPIHKGPIIFPRQNSTADPSVVLAFVLETAFKQFYSEAAGKFNATDFENAGFSNGDAVVSLVGGILSAESRHLKEVQKISSDPDSLPNCTFDFSGALVDPVTTMATAQVAEVIGSGAYMGAVATETNSKTTELYAQIMGVEEQHYEILTDLLQGNSTAQAFGLAITADEVLLLVTPFAPSCDAALPTPPNLALNITNPPPYTDVSTLNLDLSNTACANLAGAFCQFLTGDDDFSRPVPISNNSCPLGGFQGPAMVFVTNSSIPIPGDPTQRNSLPSNYCAGPALIIVNPDAPTPLPIINTSGSS